MSRPFSYHDENLDVIGNILFVHSYIPCLRVFLADGTISSATVTSAGVVTLTAAAKGKLIIDGTLDIECNY